MHDGREDPLDGLRRAWSGVRPPPRSGRLEDEDPATRATVAWMREAWRRLEIPAARVPRRVRAAGRRPRARLRAAAAILLALGGWLVAGGLLGGGPRGGGADAGAVDASVPRVVRTTADRIELVSGNVRLTLLQPQPLPEETR